ncbi:hypothetical protein J6S88_02930 [bacterium]|nr:hypothetical protein [bacterium]
MEVSEVSFKGISNVKVCRGKQLNKIWGFFPSVTGEIKEGEKVYRDYKLFFHLINDAQKADFDELLDALAKANQGFTTSYFPGTPNKIELFMRRYEVEDDVAGNLVYSVFKVNGWNIPLISQKGLSVYSKLAEITRRILCMPDVTPKQKECVSLFNDAIAQEAERFIEIM